MEDEEEHEDEFKVRQCFSLNRSRYKECWRHNLKMKYSKNRVANFLHVAYFKLNFI